MNVAGVTFWVLGVWFNAKRDCMQKPRIICGCTDLMPIRTRRLVTGHDDTGKSCFIFDSEATSAITIDAMGGLTVTDFWETEVSPANNEGMRDGADRKVHLEPAPTGTIFRTVEFPPDSGWKDGADAVAGFAALGAKNVADVSHPDPNMHRTDTIDYALVISGEIWAVMDTEERLMRTGDVIVQRGTNHAWRNRTEVPCLVLFVQCGAERVNHENLLED